MSKTKVLLVDGHPIDLIGLRDILGKEETIQIVGEVNNVFEALRFTRSLRPDIIIIDFDIPQISSVDIIKELQILPGTNILVLSSSTDFETVQGILSLVDGYLSKEEVTNLLVEAILGIAKGEKGWFSRKIINEIIRVIRDDNYESSIRKPQLWKKAGLTKRQFKVLGGIVDGKTQEKIALELGVSEKSVSSMLYRIYRKLGVSSSTEAAVYAIRKKWF